MVELKVSLVKNNVQIKNITSHRINTLDRFRELFNRANSNKSIDSTVFNSQSSRGHTIYKLIIKNKSSNESGLINIIDLAGSEKFSGEKMKKLNIPKNKIDKIRKEAIKINQSLGSLRKVFKVLMESRFTMGIYK